MTAKNRSAMIAAIKTSLHNEISDYAGPFPIDNGTLLRWETERHELTQIHYMELKQEYDESDAILRNDNQKLQDTLLAAQKECDRLRDLNHELLFGLNRLIAITEARNIDWLDDLVRKAETK